MLQIRDAQRRHAVLTDPEQVAGAAQREIDLGQFETIGGAHERIEPIACSLVARLGKDGHVAGKLAAAHAAAQLVQLRQSEAFAALDRQQGGVRHVHAHFDHGSRHQHLGLTATKPVHGRFFVRGRQPAMNQVDPKGLQRAVCESLVDLLDARQRGGCRSLPRAE